MPSSSSVHEQLTDILVRVVGCPADAVVPEANLKALGTDSLTIVEMAEELGRRFDIYLSDDTIDELDTVKDAINAVVRHDGSAPPGGSTRIPASLSLPPSPAAAATTRSPAVPPPMSQTERRHRRHLGERLVVLFVVLGAAIGAAFGLGGSALVSASGISSVDLPALNSPTTAPSSPSPTPTRTPEATTPAEQDPKPTLQVSSTHVSPGERFTLSGSFPSAGDGVELQVQVKDKGSAWDDFPVTTKTTGGGSYKTQIYTSRTGEREFRMTNKKAAESSPPVTVEIG